jgi:hypothetical protein
MLKISDGYRTFTVSPRRLEVAPGIPGPFRLICAPAVFGRPPSGGACCQSPETCWSGCGVSWRLAGEDFRRLLYLHGTSPATLRTPGGE